MLNFQRRRRRTRRRTDQDLLLKAESLAVGGVAPPYDGRIRVRRKVPALRNVAVATGLLLAVYASVSLLLRADATQQMLQQTLSRSLGRQVKIGSSRLSIIFGSLIASDVSVADDLLFSAEPFFRAPRLEISFRWFPLIFSRRLEISGVAINEPTITAIENAGQWNYSGVFRVEPTPATQPAGPRIDITRGVLVIRGSGRDGPFVLRDLAFHAAHFSTAQDNAFTLSANVPSGGTLKVEGRTGPLKSIGTERVMPFNVVVNARKIALRESNLLSGISTGIGGVLSFDGSVEGDESRVLINGHAEIFNLRLAEQGEPAKEHVRLLVEIDHRTTTASGSILRCDAVLPSGAAAISGTYFLSENGALI